MASPQLVQISRFCIVAADFPRLVAFYRDVLGLAPEGDETRIDPGQMALLRLSGAGRRQILRLGDQHIAIDGFDQPGRPYPQASDAASLCFQHLAIVVADIEHAYARLHDTTPITEGGPQQLPQSSGGVQAFKFRDPEGHPLEFLQFPAGGGPERWRGRTARGTGIGVGIDHSAISVSDLAASIAFYRDLGLADDPRTLNHGPEQQRLDALPNVEVDVVPMQPKIGPPHLELLHYREPSGTRNAGLEPNDVAATRIVWAGTQRALLADPDGHLFEIKD